MNEATRHPQSGAIAIFLSSILAILLLVTTTYAARLQVSEIQQSSQVDRSEQAYYAAEAGLEEALRRLEANKDSQISELFPHNNTGGDKAALIDDEGNVLSGTKFAITKDAKDAAGEFGRLSWRHRQITGAPLLAGTQVKDESIQLDTSQLQRPCSSGQVAGIEPPLEDKDCNGVSIFSNLNGIQYGWANIGEDVDPVVELTVVSWPGNNFAASSTQKLLYQDGAALDNPQPLYGNALTGCSGINNCLRYQTNDKSRRYIFRVKLLYDLRNPALKDQTDHNQYAVNYTVKILDATNQGNLAMSEDSFVIDVVGQSGDIRRRIVAVKQRSGRLLGIFDYVLYSDSEEKPLCKAGVSESDLDYSDDCLDVLNPDLGQGPARSRRSFALNWNERIYPWLKP